LTRSFGAALLAPALGADDSVGWLVTLLEATDLGAEVGSEAEEHAAPGTNIKASTAASRRVMGSPYAAANPRDVIRIEPSTPRFV
jgi:hypothetical protein